MYSARILPLVCFGQAVEKNLISILYEVIVLVWGVSDVVFHFLLHLLRTREAQSKSMLLKGLLTYHTSYTCLILLLGSSREHYFISRLLSCTPPTTSNNCYYQTSVFSI